MGPAHRTPHYPLQKNNSGPDVETKPASSKYLCSNKGYLVAKTSQPLSKQKGELLGPDNCLRHRKVPNSPLQGKNYPRKNDGPQRMCVISTPKEELPERLSKPGLEKKLPPKGKEPQLQIGLPAASPPGHDAWNKTRETFITWWWNQRNLHPTGKILPTGESYSKPK